MSVRRCATVIFEKLAEAAGIREIVNRGDCQFARGDWQQETAIFVTNPRSPSGARESGQVKISSGLLYILRDLFPERLHGRELDFFAYTLQKANLDLGVGH